PISAAVAPPVLVTARLCLLEIAARDPGNRKPRPMPAFSMSQAALSFTGGSVAGGGGAGMAGPSPRGAATSAGSGPTSQRGAWGGSERAKFSPTIGLVKNDPHDTESGSAGSSTMPFDARRASTVARTDSSGTRSPSDTPSAVLSCG